MKCPISSNFLFPIRNAEILPGTPHCLSLKNFRVNLEMFEFVVCGFVSIVCFVVVTSATVVRNSSLYEYIVKKVILGCYLNGVGLLFKKSKIMFNLLQKR